MIKTLNQSKILYQEIIDSLSIEPKTIDLYVQLQLLLRSENLKNNVFQLEEFHKNSMIIYDLICYFQQKLSEDLVN